MKADLDELKYRILLAYNYIAEVDSKADEKPAMIVTEQQISPEELKEQLAKFHIDLIVEAKTEI